MPNIPIPLASQVEASAVVPPLTPIERIDQQQNEVIRALDVLNERVEKLLAECVDRTGDS